MPRGKRKSTEAVNNVATNKVVTNAATNTTTARTVKNRSSEDKISALQTKIDSHKQQIANLEKRKTALQNEIRNQAVNGLASFMEKKHVSVSDVKRLINQSIAKTPAAATASKMSTATMAVEGNRPTA